MFYLTLKPWAEETRNDQNYYGYHTYDEITNTYTWNLEGHLDGTYTVTENNYLSDSTAVAAFCRVYEAANSQDWQAYTGEGIEVAMKVYPEDEKITNYQTVAFRNYYVKSGNLRLHKVDSFTHDNLPGVSFQIESDNNRLDLVLKQKPGTSMYSALMTEGSAYTEEVTGNTVVTDKNGDLFLELTAGTYILTETFPDGYGGAAKIKFTVDNTGTLTSLEADGSAQSSYVSGVGSSTLTVQNESRLLTTVTAKKDWGSIPEGSREDVIVRLMVNGAALSDINQVYTQTLNAENNWTCIWNDLPLFINGSIAGYTIREVQIGNTAYDSSVDALDGYRDYVESDLGSVVTLTNMNGSAEILDKNQSSAWGTGGGKFVQNGATWEKTTSAGLGDPVQFQVVFNQAYNYAKDKPIEKYIIQDTEGAAIKVDFHTVKVFVNGLEVTNGYINNEHYDFKNNNTLHDAGHPVDLSDKTTTAATSNWRIIHTNGSGKFQIEIDWQNADNSFKYNEAAGNTIWVEYTGYLDSNAYVGNLDNAKNQNTAYVQWDCGAGTDKGQTGNDTVTVYTYAAQLVKADGNNKTAFLAGAEFQLKDSAGNVLKLLKAMSSSDERDIYYLATDYAKSSLFADAEYDSENDVYTSFTTPASGKVEIRGLNAGTYQFVETKAPAGYNQLKDPVQVTVAQSASMVTAGADAVVSVEIANFQGTQLPSTGGIGTTIFYVLGAILVIAAAVLLIARKRTRSRD